MNKSSSSFLSWMYDARVRGIITQISLIAAVIFGAYWLVDNTLTNLEAQGKSLGFGFLFQTAGFQINQTFGTWLFDYNAGSSTYLEVYYIGIANTFLVAALGIFLATILGFAMGIMRLSNNFVVRTFASIYVEFIRNIPLLLQLFFWYFAVLRALPNKRDKVEIIPDMVGMNITGLYMPAPIPQDGFGYLVWSVVLAIVLIIGLSRWAAKRQQTTGQRFPVFWTGLGILIVLPMVVYYAAGQPVAWSLPEFSETGPILRRGYQAGAGMQMIPEMIAVLLALSLYTAGFIAEIVRAGILAVNKGQSEASFALGLRPGITMRLVIIPQALRVIIPPLTSQYLNLTKNSSLAVAIAYPELVSIFAGTALNQVGKEIEMIFMMMSVYLTFSVVTAMFMNWFNARVKLIER